MQHKKNDRTCSCEDCLAEEVVSRAEEAADRGIYETEMWRMNAGS